MFDVPVDGLYAWLGVAATSTAILGVATGLPTAPPPDAAGVADTVDRAAATRYGATAEHPVDAAAVRITPTQVGVRNDAGTVHARFAYGPVTPVDRGTALHRVLVGVPPTRAFPSERAFVGAAERARTDEPEWRRVDGPIRVRHVVVGGEDVTLVGT